MDLVNMIKLGAMGFKPSDIKEFSAKGVNTDQIIELSKAGYKVEDVNELIKLAENEPAAAPEEKPQEKPENPERTPEEKKQLDDTAKALEEARKELEEQKAIVKNLQNKNANKDLGQPDQETPEQKFIGALRNIY